MRQNLKGVIPLAFVVFGAIAIVVLVIALKNSNFDIRMRAASIPPVETVPPITPTPTPPPGNHNPIITTSSLPTAIYRQRYSAFVEAYDPDQNDRLSMILSNLPQGLVRGPCTIWVSQRGAETKCEVGGTPTVVGSYKIDVKVSDNRGGVTKSAVSLTIIRKIGN